MVHGVEVTRLGLIRTGPAGVRNSPIPLGTIADNLRHEANITQQSSLYNLTFPVTIHPSPEVSLSIGFNLRIMFSLYQALNIPDYFYFLTLTPQVLGNMWMPSL